MQLDEDKRKGSSTACTKSVSERIEEKVPRNKKRQLFLLQFVIHACVLSTCGHALFDNFVNHFFTEGLKIKFLQVMVK